MDSNIKDMEDTKQYIVVKLGDEQFGIDISYVENIVRLPRITRVPKAQPYFRGVINIRGEIIPVMSLRLKFLLKEDVYVNTTRILILKIEPQASVGVIVDEVKEVVTLDESHIDRATSSGQASYLAGVGKHADGLISILNITDVIIEKETAI